jgi:hypothetical protein
MEGEYGWTTKDVEMIQQLNHPGILKIYVSGVSNGLYFEVMELLKFDLFDWVDARTRYVLHNQ